MEATETLVYLKDVLENSPNDWLNLTTHRLDIYEEKLAKTQFLDRFDVLFNANISDTTALKELPTAYDYIRLGHPLSCVLEWGIARLNSINPENVISFSSQTTPILAILRKNALANKNTLIVHSGEMPHFFDADLIRSVYGYSFELISIKDAASISTFDGSTIFVTTSNNLSSLNFAPIGFSGKIDFFVNLYPEFGSIIIINGEQNEHYIPEIQHVRRRETIAMTPINCLALLNQLVGKPTLKADLNVEGNKVKVLKTIEEITVSPTKALIGSSGLSVQYAIMMGLIDHAQENHPGKAIKFVVPPNCYGGTNDQARRVAACLPNVEIMDLPVDGGNNMVQSVHQVLDKIAEIDALAYIIAEIPTNPRVEVPDLVQLRDALSQERKTPSGESAIDPVFILDQTFCPNVHFLGENDLLSAVRTISYVSGSKFPSGGKCTAGYCVGNAKTADLMTKIELHLELCDNQATDFQMKLLADQMPSMNQRIRDAYKNTREFVNFIQKTLPEAKINFVSEELAAQGFTPSVFSLDLPTKGSTDEEREVYKRELNHTLINLMITRIPNESKYCVSYGQLKGCYWTIPATSTQGTTKEGDKDYIARVALSHNMDLELHKQVFAEFVEGI